MFFLLHCRIFFCIFAPEIMSFLLRNSIQSNFAKDAGRLLGANIFAQAIGILVYPILTRMYAPEDFGLLNLFLSIGGVLALISTAEYQSAILIPLKDSEAASVARVAMRIVALLMLIIAISVPFSGAIAKLFGAPSLSSFYYLLIPYVGAMGLWSIYNAWLTRRRGFTSISGYQLTQSMTGVLTKLLFGVIGWLRSGLIFSSVLSPIIALIAILRFSKKDFRAIWQTHSESMRVIARRYHRFPFYSMPRSLVNNLSGNLPALLLTPFFGLYDLGFFSMAMTLAFRPITMITASLHQVLFERVAGKVREEKSVWQWLVHRWLLLAAGVVLVMGILTLIMPWLVTLFLGEGWGQTATLIRYMMPWLTCVFLVSPLAFISEIFSKQRLFLVIECVYLVLRVLSMVTGILANNFELAIILMSSVGTLVLLVQMGCYVYFLRRYESTRLTKAG